MNEEIYKLINILNINYEFINKIIIQKYNITLEQTQQLLRILILNMLNILQTEQQNKQSYNLILFYRNIFYNIFISHKKTIIKQIYISLNIIKKLYEHKILTSIKNILVHFKNILTDLHTFSSASLNVFYNQSKIIINKFNLLISNNIIKCNIINKLNIDMINNIITLNIHNNTFIINTHDNITNNENINIILGIISTNINIITSYH